MGIFIFIYILVVWIWFPDVLIDNPPTSFMVTWIVSQLVILYAIRLHKAHSQKTGSEQSMGAYIVFYFISSIVMVGVSCAAPYIVGSINEAGVNRVIELAQEEFKEHTERELPELVMNADRKITEVRVQVVQSVPSKEDKTDYYGNIIEVDVNASKYRQPKEVEALYNAIYEARLDIVSNSCPNREIRREAVNKYRGNRYVEVADIRDGIRLRVECPNHIYYADSNADLRLNAPSGELTEITDELSKESWYNYDETDLVYNGSYGKRLWATREQVERMKQDKQLKEQAAEEESKKSQSKKESSDSTGRIDMEGGLGSYDAGYDDVDINDEFDEYRYEHDYDYALGVDDAMDDTDDWY